MKDDGNAIRHCKHRCIASEVVLNPVAAFQRRFFSVRTFRWCRCMLNVLAGRMHRSSFESPRPQDGCDSTEMWWIDSDTAGTPFNVQLQARGSKRPVKEQWPAYWTGTTLLLMRSLATGRFIIIRRRSCLHISPYHSPVPILPAIKTSNCIKPLNTNEEAPLALLRLHLRPLQYRISHLNPDPLRRRRTP